MTEDNETKVAGDDTFGSKQGAGAAQDGPKEPVKPEASGSDGSGSSTHEQSLAADPSHHEGVPKGEEMANDKEAGRYDSGTTGAGRPAGGSTARDSTGINPQDPIDPESPNTPANQ